MRLRGVCAILGGMLNAEDLMTQLRIKATWHEAEAARYRTALEVVSAETETGIGSAEKPSAEKRAVANVSPGGRTSRTDTVPFALAAVTGQDREWSVPDVVAAMEQAGWSTNVTNKVNTVRTALSRLADRGEIERVRHGVYTRRHVGDAQDATTDAPSLSALNGSGSFAFEEAQA